MLPQFYNKVTALNVAQHKALHVKPVKSLLFASESDAIYLQVSEFRKALSTYPIVFIGELENLRPLALTGLGNKKNLFVEPEGDWSGVYIPAYVRRYPFVIANVEENKSTVCIDESYMGFNNDGIGEPLFKQDGKHSEFLTKTLTFLEDFEKANTETRFFCQQLVSLDLLEPMKAKIEPNNEKRNQVLLQGFNIVSREKLAELPTEILKQINNNGVLELIYNHLASLEQFEALLARYNR